MKKGTGGGEKRSERNKGAEGGLDRWCRSKEETNGIESSRKNRKKHFASNKNKSNLSDFFT